MKWALSGRIASMAGPTQDRGVVWIDGARIAEVTPRGAPRPAGFESVEVIATGGTLMPGLIELHNHLAYDALPLWNVDKQYGNRDRWAGVVAYRANVTGPMKIIGSSPDLLAALIRYVECKCLLAGVTTSQGIALFSNAGVRRFYRGLIRNVEQTLAEDLPDAKARIADIEAREAQAFAARLAKETCLLLHLAEGTDAPAHAHFTALEFSPGKWALGAALAGIHCVALTSADFDRMAQAGASLVWSPLSNFLLYGKTAAIDAARASGLRIGLGADWSYSGSKNLLAELEVAQLAAAGRISDRAIVEMATRDAAQILGWGEALGTLSKGQHADLLVRRGTSGDPFEQLIRATERDLSLVVIDGVARAGTPELMAACGAQGERVDVGGEVRVVALRDAASDPAVASLSLAEAVERLRGALARLPELARDLEERPQLNLVGPAFEGPPVWYLALDELTSGEELRPRFDRPHLEVSAAPTRPLSQVVHPIELDALTVAGDATYRRRLAMQRNLPVHVREAFLSPK